MQPKPKLTRLISPDAFKDHYWLKVELIAFCKDYALSTAGSKQEISHRIETFIATGKKIKSAPNRSASTRDSLKPITLDTLVVHYKNDAATRNFFVGQIGQHFHFDSFLRQFTNKNNITVGLTYGDLVNGWLAQESKRNNPLYESNIGEQFEYNQFTRDFFANETVKSRADAINAWKFIKNMPGARTYDHYKSIIRRRRIMKKVTVNIQEIKIIGLSARTNNKNEMNPQTSKIGELMGRYWNKNIAAQISDRKNPGVTISVYTEYDSNEHGDYTYFIGEEVSSFENTPSTLQKLTIPAAKYQKFTTHQGKMPEVVINAWQQIWGMSEKELGGKRAYQADFELYDQRAVDPVNTSLDIYIGIKS